MTFPAGDDQKVDSGNQRQAGASNQKFNLAPGAVSIQPSLASSPKRIGDASNDGVPPFSAANSNDPTRPPEQPDNNGTNQSAATQAQVLRTSIIGPEALTKDIPGLFEIEVTNNSSQLASDIIVQMEVSEDLTITEFDRQAWLDRENRTVSWRLESIPRGLKDVIRFRAVSRSTGNHKHNVKVGMEDSFQGQTSFVTLVIEKPITALPARPVSGR